MLSFNKKTKNAEQVCQRTDYSPIILKTRHGRRASNIIKKYRASLCLEAALTIPFFLAAIIAMLFIIQAMLIRVRFSKALYNQQIRLSGYAYYLDKLDISDTLEGMMEAEYVKAKVVNEIGKSYLNSSYIVNGYKGIHADLFTNPEDGEIVVTLYYQMAVPYNLFFIPRIDFEVSMTCHSWVGKSTKETETKTVYVTPSGTVYHLYKDCSYIKSVIDSCLLSSIQTKRNSDGSKYYPCSLCCSESINSSTTVYYTSYGTKYHENKNCGNLKNNIFSMSLEEAAKKYRVCSKCEKR